MFEIGNTVSVIDDNIDGVVSAIEGDIIVIDTDDGFPMKFHKSELVKTGSTDFHFKGIGTAKVQKENFKKRPKRNVKPKERDEAEMVVDLHIEKLVKSKHGMSNYEILTKQLDTAKYYLDLAIKKGMRKIVFVHGVGEGVLKADLYSLFRRYDNIRYYEASYAKFGQGATEIYIYQNVPS